LLLGQCLVVVDDDLRPAVIGGAGEREWLPRSGLVQQYRPSGVEVRLHGRIGI
jgi:hypothetical protein